VYETVTIARYAMTGAAFVRPWRCGCDKIRYRSEDEARSVADRHPQVYGTDFRVYKCPGARPWHIATRGFHPRALKSRARIMAYHISARRIVDTNWIIERELGLTPRGSGWRSAHRLVGEFAQLGLVRYVERPGTRTVEVTDADGLFRVIQVGWEQYRADHPVAL
jgi:hypothetical protein